MDQASPEARKVFITAAKTQIQTENPPEARQTYNRLISEGIPKNDAILHIAQAISYEFYDMMKDKRDFDNENYISLLSKLPNLD